MLVLATIVVVAWLARGQESPERLAGADAAFETRQDTTAESKAVASALDQDSSADASVQNVAVAKANNSNAPPMGWAARHGIGADQQFDAIQLVKNDLAGAIALAESGDIFVLAALGRHFQRIDPERAYNYYDQAALYGSSSAFRSVGWFHSRQAEELRAADDGSADLDARARRHELLALAYVEVTAHRTAGRAFIFNWHEYQSALMLSEEEIDWVCKKWVSIYSDVEARQFANGIVPSSKKLDLSPNTRINRFLCPPST